MDISELLLDNLVDRHAVVGRQFQRVHAVGEVFHRYVVHLTGFSLHQLTLHVVNFNTLYIFGAVDVDAVRSRVRIDGVFSCDFLNTSRISHIDQVSGLRTELAVISEDLSAVFIKQLEIAITVTRVDTITIFVIDFQTIATNNSGFEGECVHRCAVRVQIRPRTA